MSDLFLVITITLALIACIALMLRPTDKPGNAPR